MIEYYTILILQFLPEISYIAGFLHKPLGSWWGRMIEDSDGDPHHVDGKFMILLYAAVWCFHIAIIAGLKTIYQGKDLNNVAITFLTAGAGLLGIGIAIKPKFPVSQPQ